jgi:hypothetical protein
MMHSEDDNMTLSTNERNSSTETLFSIPVDYQCRDTGYIRLYIGGRGEVGELSVNLREQPTVPEDSKQNVIGYLLPGNIVNVIDGPTCAEGGYVVEGSSRRVE